MMIVKVEKMVGVFIFMVRKGVKVKNRLILLFICLLVYMGRGDFLYCRLLNGV